MSLMAVINANKADHRVVTYRGPIVNAGKTVGYALETTLVPVKTG